MANPCNKNMKDSLLDLPIGSAIVTDGHARFFPPYPWQVKKTAEEIGKAVLYNQIREYSRGQGYIDPRGTHVRFKYSAATFFEMTYPKGRAKVPLIELVGKPAILCVPLAPFDRPRFIAACQSLDGQPYDTMELLDFMVSGWLKIVGNRLRILDRAKRFVCSTAGAWALAEAGFPFPLTPTGIIPAWYHNRPLFFKNVYEGPVVL
jgi:hypothetical protein